MKNANHYFIRLKKLFPRENSSSHAWKNGGVEVSELSEQALELTKEHWP